MHGIYFEDLNYYFSGSQKTILLSELFMFYEFYSVVVFLDDQTRGSHM